MNKYILSALAAVVIFGAIIGAYQYPKYSFTPGTVSTAPTTVFNTAKVAEAGFAPTVDSATTTPILNTDATDRVVIDSFYYCNSVGTSKTYLTGTGLANLIFSISTSSTATGYGITNANYLLRSNVSTTTSDTSIYTASSTTPFPGDSSRLWAAGSYILIYANATNTASCVAGVHYLGS